jgi:hypothetical protein
VPLDTFASNRRLRGRVAANAAKSNHKLI